MTVAGPAMEAVVCDFGGVLTNPLLQSFAGFAAAREITLESLGEALQAIAERDGEHPLFALERGETTEAAFLAAVGAELSARLGRPVPMDDFPDRYWAGLHANEPLLDWLRAARGRGLRLALLTNNVREWEPRWRAMVPVDELFEVVVDSSAVGLRKPDPRIYELTLARLGLPAAACAFLDDLEPNCAAATALGLRAVRFESTGQATAALDALLS